MKATAVAALAGWLALSPGVVALAQDELPRDAPPPPQVKQPVTPPVRGVPGTPQAASPSAAQPPPPGTLIDQPWAMLQALDKITARVRRLPVKVGDTAAFGTLSIEVDACRKAPPEDPPESAAFLKVTDRTGATPHGVFDGWMFASSPALSAMDHPIYDISVVDCPAEAPGSAAPAPGSASPAH